MVYIVLTDERIMQVIEETGVLQKGHFKLTSGRHSDRYMQCARLFEYPEHSALLCAELARRFANAGAELVIGPAIGGIIMSYEVARALGVRNIFAERQDGAMKLRRGFVVRPGQKVLVVEDVITTGGSVKEVIQLLEQAGAEIVGVGVVVDRSAGKIDFGYPLHSLVSMSIESFLPEECALCEKGLPIDKPGSRK